MEIKPTVASGWDSGGDFTEGHEGMFGGDWNILDLNCGGGYLTVYVCQNSQICALKWYISLNVNHN